MALDELTRLVAPPEHPIETCDVERWRIVQDDLHVVFPEDYRQYASAYGSGKFVDESIQVIVFNPCAKGYRDRVRDTCSYLMDVKNGPLGKHIPYKVFPDLPGLFPWGWDANGNDLFWLINEAAGEYPIIARAEGYDFQRFDLPMTSFLARCMKREIDCILWNQEGFFPDPHKIAFVPEPLHTD